MDTKTAADILIEQLNSLRLAISDNSDNWNSQSQSHQQQQQQQQQQQHHQHQQHHHHEGIDGEASPNCSIKNTKSGCAGGPKLVTRRSTTASDDSPLIRKDKVVVELRVVFLKIGEIDTLKEIYHAEIFTQAKWREPTLDGRSPEELMRLDLQKWWNPLLSIDNILTETKDQYWISAHCNERAEAYLIERRKVKGIFMETLELNDFPLDVQDLTITVTSERPDSEVDLVPDNQELSGINLKTFVDQQEWKLHEHIEITKTSVAHEYSSSMKSHPFLSVTCRASRRPGYFYWNVFLIMFFITGLSFATFSLPPERPENRLQLSFTLFLTSVAFKFVINQSLPKISYLTYMDKYVLMSLAILCVVSLWHATVTFIPHENTAAAAATTGTNLQTVNSSPSSLHTIPPNPRSNIAGGGGGNNNDYSQSDDYSNSNSDVIFNEPYNTLDNLQNSLPFVSKSPLSRVKNPKKRQKGTYLRQIEKDVFIGLCVLYLMAHLLFGFWLYFDACKRRRSMRDKDRQYKEDVLCTDV